MTTPHEEPPRPNNEAEGENALLLTRAVTFRAPVKYSPDTGFITHVWGTKKAPTTKVSESLDYDPPQNKIFYERLEQKSKGKKKLYGYTGHTLAKFIVTFVIGVITGCFAVGMSKCVLFLIEKKLHFIQDAMDAQIQSEVAEGHDMEPPTTGKEYYLAVLYGGLWYWLFGSILGTLATSMVQYWAPGAAGGGVTLVMAYLNGNHIPNLLRFSTLITKFIGTICSVSSGMPMGPEAPMVHIGACVASVITYMDFRFLTSGKLFGRLKVKEVAVKEKLKVLDEIASDSDHREFVSAGATSGIAAAFCSPIGGVLFAMEEACTFWSRKTAWRCFIAAALAVYATQILNPALGKGAIPFININPLNVQEWGMQLPFLLINFAMAGLLGAAFNSLRMWLWKIRAAKTLHLQRIAEVIGLMFLTSALAFFFSSTVGKCLKMPTQWFPEEEYEYGVRFLCPYGEHNDLATLFLSSTHETIIKLFSMGQGSAIICDPEAHDYEECQQLPFQPYFSKSSLIVFVACYLPLMSIAAGLAIPAGLFMPSIVMGSAWGGMWGYFIMGFLPSHWHVQPGLYAMLAATGVLGGVFRSAISLVVLMVESTRGVDYLFGIILAVVVANWVAHHIHHDGVYESELENTGNVYMLQSEPPSRLQTLTTAGIMSTTVHGFKSIESVSRVLEVLRTTTHNGFPVWARESEDVEEGEPEVLEYGEDGERRLKGIILRSQLLVLLQRRHFVNEEGQPIGREQNNDYELELDSEMRTFFRRYYTHARYISATKQPLDELNLDVNTQLYVDLRPYMNRTPITIRRECAASRAHQVFVNLNLRHLLVVDSHSNVVGIITRKDLDHAAGHGWWRMSHVAEPPNKKGVISKISNSAFFKHFKLSSNSGDNHAAGDAEAGRVPAPGHGHAHVQMNGQGNGH